MSLNIYRFFMQFSNLKAFHRFANKYLKERYPNFPNYENFLKATNKSFPMMMLFVNSVLAKNREKCAGETIHFIDSTPVEVCKNNQHTPTQSIGGIKPSARIKSHGIKSQRTVRLVESQQRDGFSALSCTEFAPQT